jgi:hypothetical protein
MTKLTICRTNIEMPTGNALEVVRTFLFGAIDGACKDDRKAWRHFWKRVIKMEPGEMALVEMVFPRSGPFHRRHMKIEQTLFDAQERFKDFDMFRDWLKIGAAWVVWVPGAKGGIVPLPKSISYAKADEEEFRQFHLQVMDFLRDEHAAPYLWRHLKGDEPHEMMSAILSGFGE